MTQHPDRAAFLLYRPHRDPPDPILPPDRNMQYLEIDGETIYRHQREQLRRDTPPESLDPTLRIKKSWCKKMPDKKGQHPTAHSPHHPDILRVHRIHQAPVPIHHIQL
jgi:hypothetical protein